MTRTLASIAVLGLLSATTLKAENPRSFLGSLDFSPPVPTQRADTACANFAGSWKGTCTSPTGDAPVDEAFTVGQDGCNLVEFNANNQKVKIPVGGSFSVGGAIPGEPAVSFGGSLTSSWNTSKNVLSLYVMAGGKKLTVDGAGGGFFVKEDIQLANPNRLAVDVFAVGSANKVLFCQFDKQSR